METVLGVLAFLAAVAAGVGCWRAGGALAARLGKGAGETAAGAALVATVVPIWFVRRHPASLPLWLVLSPLVYLEFSYFLPTLVLFLGLAGRRVPRPETRRALAFLAGVVSLYAAFHLWLAFDSWSLPQLMAAPPAGPIQPQTTGWSCGADACVNLLKAHGIRSSEREMGELCMTMPYRGTTLPRFVRGLTRKLAAEGSRLRVRAADSLKVSDLDTFPAPCILSIRGGLLVGHAVVLLGRTPEGLYRIADSLGRGLVSTVPREELDALFTGEAVALVP
jgi:hypothetical protein